MLQWAEENLQTITKSRRRIINEDLIRLLPSRAKCQNYKRLLVASLPALLKNVEKYDTSAHFSNVAVELLNIACPNFWI